jgi:hypothetical protein
MSAEAGKSPSFSPPRRARRFPAHVLPTLKASILAGPDVRIINFSRFGILIESALRLSPGASVCLNITLDNRTFPASGRVTRVDAGLSGGQVKYRAAVSLDAEVAAFDLKIPEAPRPAVAQRPQANVPAKPVAAPAAARPAAAAEPPVASPSSQEDLHILRTALRASEAQRKELAVEHEAERAKWEAQRKQLEQMVAQAKRGTENAEKQLAVSQAAHQGEVHGVRKELSDAQKALLSTQKTLEALQKAEAAARAEISDAQKDLSAVKQELAVAQKQAAVAKEAEQQLAKTHSREHADWLAERKSLEERLKDAAAQTARVEKDLKDAGSREKALATRFDEAKGAWETERREFQQAMKETSARAEQTSRELSAAHDKEQRLSRKVDEQSATIAQHTKKLEEQAKKLEALLEDKKRLEGEVESLREVERAAAADREKWNAQTAAAAERLEFSESVCADQKDLLLQLRQQVGEAFALIDSWNPPEEVETTQPAEADAKGSPMKKLRKIIG